MSAGAASAAVNAIGQMTSSPRLCLCVHGDVEATLQRILHYVDGFPCDSAGIGVDGMPTGLWGSCIMDDVDIIRVGTGLKKFAWIMGLDHVTPGRALHRTAIMALDRYSRQMNLHFYHISQYRCMDTVVYAGEMPLSAIVFVAIAETGTRMSTCLKGILLGYRREEILGIFIKNGTAARFPGEMREALSTLRTTGLSPHDCQ